MTVSFIRPEHYPQGIRESHDVHDMTGNMFFDYTIFGYKRALPVIRKKSASDEQCGDNIDKAEEEASR